MNALLVLLSKFSSSWMGRKILYWLGGKLWESGYQAVKDWFMAIRQGLINKKNIEEYKNSVQDPTKGDQEVMEDGKNLLNGNRKP